MSKDKQAVFDLVEICNAKGLKTVVISPGSRNAPLVSAFLKHPSIECLSIIDERSAAFIALGIAQQTNETVALLCTSGSAALNYAPAISEAFYQKIPLLILTADRPIEWLNQGEGQTIDQYQIFHNYIRSSYQLPQNPAQKDELWHSNRVVSEALNTSKFPIPGPVHINIPLSEPLYKSHDKSTGSLKKINLSDTKRILSDSAQNEIVKDLNSSNKILLITGSLKKNERLNELVNQFAQADNVAVFTETTSNLNGDNLFPCIDRLISSIQEDEIIDLIPDLLITIGDQIISKKIKALLRKNKAKQHWHVDASNIHLDTFQSLSTSLCIEPIAFFEQIVNDFNPPSSDYKQRWSAKNTKAEKRHIAFLNQVKFSDLGIFQKILSAIPSNSNLQMGNSSPVRYIQLFDNQKKLLQFNGNRGTSGIDGCTSTAVGAAMVNQNTTTLITGDIAFFYDSNAFWNNYLSPMLRIIVINNSGGGIFRFIEGPDTIDNFETFIETHHNLKAKTLVKSHGLNYFYADNFSTLDEALKSFYSNDNKKASVLEIATPREENAIILKQYFEHLKQ